MDRRDSRALSRYRAQLADGVEEAYGAAYLDAGMLITVSGREICADGTTRGSF